MSILVLLIWFQFSTILCLLSVCSSLAFTLARCSTDQSSLSLALSISVHCPAKESPLYQIYQNHLLAPSHRQAALNSGHLCNQHERCIEDVSDNNVDNMMIDDRPGNNKNITRIANAVPVTLYSRVTMNVEIVVLNCQKCNQCHKGHKSLGLIFKGVL